MVSQKNTTGKTEIVHRFFRNSEYSFEYIEISALRDEAKYKSLDEENSEYIQIDDLDAFAQTVINTAEVSDGDHE